MSISIKPAGVESNLPNQIIGKELFRQNDVSESVLCEERGFPLLLRSNSKSTSPAQWIAQNQQKIQQSLNQYGALLLRDFQLSDENDFREAANQFIPTIAKYMEGATPRTDLGKGTYTSTEFPNELSIAQHNELSYVTQWPMKIAFCCLVAPEQGGATPIADVRQVLAFIDKDVRDKFDALGWTLVRNFGNGLGPTWQKSFNTHDIEEVKAYCQRAEIDLEVISEYQIRTRQTRPAIRRHIHTNEQVWFNHAAFWHPSSLCPIIRKELVSQFGEGALTYNTLYGDGSVIEDEVITHINEAYDKATVSFPWNKGDLLLMDNMLVSHGRAPFEGQRRIVVSMGDPVNSEASVS
jgi:alpha-ketoglutarate-dependent taurine dioxygenase|mmetsp:Transcript_25449/g.66604  ORF Transcript_25449/g.66604 Transcript_25449/m.66604 type:complete len:351 (+) Transcript_25449:323-1375(+)